MSVSIAAAGLGLACFRPDEDAFFVVAINGPREWSKQRVDPSSKKLKPTDDATSEEFGGITVFIDGVQNSSSSPILFFRGAWKYPTFGLSFAADKVNQTMVDDNNWVLSDGDQFRAATRYSNRFDKEIDYRLVIQRSTGRFTETFQTVSERVPFTETKGRCVKLN